MAPPPGSAATAVATASTPPSSGLAPTLSAQVASSGSFENANYQASLVPPASCKKGDTCVANAIVVAKGEYHVNDKYPYRFKTQDPAPSGITYPKGTIGPDGAVLEAKRVLLPISFVASEAGEFRVGGVLSLSVCSAANCLMDKQALEIVTKVGEK